MIELMICYFLFACGIAAFYMNFRKKFARLKLPPAVGTPDRDMALAGKQMQAWHAKGLPKKPSGPAQDQPPSRLLRSLSQSKFPEHPGFSEAGHSLIFFSEMLDGLAQDVEDTDAPPRKRFGSVEEE